MRFEGFEGEWEKRKFGEEISESGYGPRFNAEDYSDNGNVKTIRGTDISLGGEILYQQVPTANLDLNFIKNHILEDGDLVMITTADCGLTGVFREQDINYIPSAYAVKIRLKTTSNSEYFKYQFQTEKAKNQINKFIRKATVSNLPGSDIYKLKFCIPNLLEQSRIASFLNLIDQKISGSMKTITSLESLIKGISEKLLTQKIRFKEFSDKWKKMRLKDICEKKSSNISANKIEDNHGKFPIYGATGFLKNVDFYEVESEYIAIIKDGAGVGRLMLCREKSSVLGTLDIILPKNTNLIFLFYLLSSIDFNKYITGSTIPHIYFKDYKNEFCIIPSLEEQTKIANLLTKISEKIETEKRLLELLEQQKKYFLQNLFV